MIYDLIGDIHGYIAPLRELLNKLHYKKIDEYLWKPPKGHRAIFIGDYIDRGQSSVAVVKTVRAMVDADYATALLGNHEYNAILYNTKKKNSDEYLRPHSDYNKKQHQETLDDFERSEGVEIEDWIDWFKTLPLYFETDKILAIHACPEIKAFKSLKKHPLIKDSLLTDEFIFKAAEKNSPEFFIIETLLKGPEHKLPAGESVTDVENRTRHVIRCNWWKLSLEDNFEFTDWSQVALSIDDRAKEQLSRLPLSPSDLELIKRKVVVPDDKIIFVGHYWETGVVKMKTDNIVCLDYSIAKGGELVCFSIDEDVKPDDDCFTVVKAKDFKKNTM